MAEEPERPQNPYRAAAEALGLAWTAPAAIGAGAGIGWLLDRPFGTRPVLTVVGAFLGGFAGLLQIYRTSKRLFEKDGP
jgi:F0F1-type ATP synthase assembly protein I